LIISTSTKKSIWSIESHFFLKDLGPTQAANGHSVAGEDEELVESNAGGARQFGIDLMGHTILGKNRKTGILGQFMLICPLLWFLGLCSMFVPWF